MRPTQRGRRSRWALTRGPLAALVLTTLACGSPPAAEEQPPSPSPDEQASSPPDLVDGKSIYSSAKEELIIRDFFGDRRGGVFLDVGAAWPIWKSNTTYLENFLGWSGIAVDALAEYGPKWREVRPRSRFFVYFVTDDMQAEQAFYRSELTDISTYRREDLERRRKKDGSPYAFEEVDVPSITLTRLLDDNGVSKVDLVSIDIEGAEMMALGGFDIDRFQPELVCIEAKPQNRKPIIEYFEAHGYGRIERYAEHDPMNYYFAPLPSLAER